MNIESMQEGLLPHVEANRKAPVVEAAEITVHAPIETVWEVISGLTSWPGWNRSVSKIRVEGPVEVGTSFEWVAGGSKIVSRLEEVDGPERIAWSGRTMGIRAIHAWKLTTVDGGTRVRTEESFEGLIVRLFPGLMRKMLSKALKDGLEALKVEAEKRFGRPGESR